MNIRPYLIRFFSSFLAGAMILLFLGIALHNTPTNSIPYLFKTYIKDSYDFILVTINATESQTNGSRIILYFTLGAVTIFIGDLFCSFFEFFITYNFFISNEFERIYHLSIREIVNNKYWRGVLTFIFLLFPLVLFFKKKSNTDDQIKIKTFAKCIRMHHDDHFAISEIFFNFHRFFGGISLSLAFVIMIDIWNLSLISFLTSYTLYNITFYLCIRYRECGNEHLHYSTIST